MHLRRGGIFGAWVLSVVASTAVCCQAAPLKSAGHKAATPDGTGADESVASFDPQKLVGARVDVTLANDETIANVEVLKVVPGTEKGTVRALTIPDAKTGRQTTVGAIRIKKVASAGGEAMLAYDRQRKLLVPTAKEARGEMTDATARDPHAWPKLNDAQQKAAVERERAFFKTIAAKVPNHGLQIYETRRFLFYSDLPRQTVTGVYLPHLDKMYQKLSEAYGLDPEANIWDGKAIIVAYLEKPSFQQHEAAFYGGEEVTEHAQGLAHLGHNGPGSVVITCYTGKDPTYFASVLVHETAHGFNYRYKSVRHLPIWLEEGIADWIAMNVVGGTGNQMKVRQAMAQMQQTGSLGGNFFTAERLETWQYGAASTLVDYLMKYNPHARHATKPAAKPRRTNVKAEDLPFRKLIDGIKSGMPWEESLKSAYGMTPAELAHNYGANIGLPRLQP